MGIPARRNLKLEDTMSEPTKAREWADKIIGCDRPYVRAVAANAFAAGQAEGRRESEARHRREIDELTDYAKQQMTLVADNAIRAMGASTERDTR